MRRIALGLALAGLAPSATLAAGPEAANCADLLPSPDAAAAATRSLTPEDLVRLRDIGPAGPTTPDARLMTLSPDGRRLAFQLRRADPHRNSYCLAMLVMEVRPGARPVIVDRGGELIRIARAFRGKAGFQTGIPRAITPHWSPDGQWIAFLKRVGGNTQIWRARADGRGSEPLFAGMDDVEDLRIGPHGRTIIFTTRPALRAARARIEQEGRSGFHYDERYAPVASNRPFPAAPVPTATHVLDLATGAVRAASASESTLLEARAPQDVLWTSAAPSQDRRAWTEQPNPFAPQTARLFVQTGNAAPVECRAPACAGASRPWWTPDGQHVRYFRREGWAASLTAIYQWTPASGTVRRLHLTGDWLVECVPSGTALICLREGAVEPRRLERLDADTGRRELLFDPNPEFARLTLGRVERLRWRNAAGSETVGDLVYPVGYRPGRRYPLVVVQYETHGFLRGGTGDEYPIQAFANRGYAVLSLARPRLVGLARGLTDKVEVERANLAGFADRRSVHSALELGLQHLIERGIADYDRLGVTGVSDGATTATFALINGTPFKVAALSHCCIDTMLPTRVGPAAASYFRASGYPPTIEPAEDFWRPISVSRNARRIRTPILLQVADTELMSALQSFTALREARSPADMYVFPDETHIKWQPAHRLAVYRRALDWFDYWLRGIRPESAERQAELRHWEVLRAGAGLPPTD
ncbi:Atxe2 family lasso peptide isopeptidase [Sphingosinicella sp. CPCC 101087]|uniref:Atxe2 family lasso peptide isopeptidase n=1 Tax=Sphingosinicella sp. CPCC 101087 TaxID=2497754 RepID=UPI00101D2BD8|nr:Atxe2 family lasso peptide isopeptidase [Sphingosinicella sp. CPCC 101087]